MASESSSAVLDMKDDEDQDLPPDGSESTAPLIMEHGYDIAVKVDAPLKQLSTLETFVTYRVRCVCARWPAPPAVRRRYNHFKALHARLCAAYWALAPPPPPPAHSPRQQLDRYAARLLRRRTCALQAFTDRIAKHPILTHSEDFRLFLTLPDDEFERAFKSENSMMNLWGLGGGYGPERPVVSGARVKDPEFLAAAEYLSSLQVKLPALAALGARLARGSAALGREYAALAAGAPPAPPFAAASLGAAAAAAARAGRGARGEGLLAFLAAYAAAVAAKIRERDALHAAHVSGTSANGDVHNRLEQASEALRAELGDWTRKARADVKAVLLDVAEQQVQIHTQTLAGWERALHTATQSGKHSQDIFKTVSATAVRNLSPSKHRTIAAELDALDAADGSDGLDVSTDASVVDFTESSEFQSVALNGAPQSAAPCVTDTLDGVSEIRELSLSDELSKSTAVSATAVSATAVSATAVNVTCDPLRGFTEVDLQDGEL